jgi:hypothetical protein
LHICHSIYHCRRRCSYQEWLMWVMHAQSEWCSQMSFCYKDVCKKVFFTSKFSYFTFLQPHTYELKPRQEIRGGTTNSKPPGPIIMMRQWESLSSSQVILRILFFARRTALLEML